MNLWQLRSNVHVHIIDTFCIPNHNIFNNNQHGVKATMTTCFLQDEMKISH